MSKNMFFNVAQAGLKAGLSSREVEELLDLAKSQPIKDKLKQATQEALDYEVGVKNIPFLSITFYKHQTFFLFFHRRLGFLS